MGREAYLARVVLGRSAFEEPLRYDDGNFVLGGQARAFDDQSYFQQWDERGHPQNLESERRAKRFNKAQNEVLADCGVIIRKDEARQRQQRQILVPNDAQLNVLHDENKIGFMVKCVDRFSGSVLTWWIESLRRRITVFGISRFQLADIISEEFSSHPIAFVAGGLPVWTAAGMARLARRGDISEPIECMNYLGLSLDTTPAPWSDQFWDWLEHFVYLSIELPFEIASTLQSLGFAIVPVIWSCLKRFSPKQWLTSSWLLDMPFAKQLLASIVLYLIQDYLHHQIGWRIYGLLRQILLQPQRATRSSTLAAETDDFVEDADIAGIGRSLGLDDDRRFYGPQSFWSALPVAFPWLSFIVKGRVDKASIKKETLARCAMMESNDGIHESSHFRLRNRRAHNIVSSLESLGVDIEEDFFVDFDQWTRQIDSLDEEEAAAEETMFVPEDVDPAQVFTNREDFLFVARELTHQERQESTPASAEPNADDSAQAENIDISHLNRPAAASNTHHADVVERPSTPEPGIIRAASLAQSTPRPIRRATETNGPNFDTEMEVLLAEARREKTPRQKKKAKGQRKFRTTRLTTHAADSLAWHASSVTTKLVLLPISIMYYRSLANWFVHATGQATNSRVLAVSNWSDVVSRLDTDRWHYQRVLLLSLGVECLIRGAIWQVGSRTALYYGRLFSWGSF